MEKVIVSLKGRDVLSKVRFIGGKKTSDGESGYEYYTTIINGRAGTLPADVAEAIQEGNVAELNYEETVYQRPQRDADGNDIDGTTEDVSTYQYVGHITNKQLKNVMQAETDIKMIELKAMKELQLTPEQAAELSATV